ncbi:hypothetical protein R9X47_02285 [Wukongibacter baidiensis]|uniref:hypothetical protein n=1 Tax=Wukongibacter baidiensis TaxID=1723361 RepID=UPI003D7F6F5C
MKKVIVLITLCSILLIVNGCISSSLEENKNEPELTSDKEIDIGWHFETSVKTDENGTEIPYTNVSLLINGEKIEIEKVLGYPEDISDFESLGKLKNPIMACRAWFGGAGTDIYIKRIDEKSLGVMWRYVDESDSDLEEFDKIKDIEIPPNVNMNITEAKMIYK